MHIPDDVQLRDALVRHFQIFQHLRNHAMHLSAIGQYGVGNDSHQAQPTTAIDEVDAARCHGLAQQNGGFGISRVLPGIGATINGQSLQIAPGRATPGRDLI